MSITDKLTKLIQIKTAIKNALINKGVEINNSTPFSSYAGLIETIQTGGNNTAQIQKDNVIREISSVIGGND